MKAIMPLFMLVPFALSIFICSCSTYGRVVAASPAYDMGPDDYGLVVERVADYPITYRPKVNEVVIGVMADNYIVTSPAPIVSNSPYFDNSSIVSPYPYYRIDYETRYGSRWGYNWPINRGIYINRPETYFSVPVGYYR